MKEKQDPVLGCSRAGLVLEIAGSKAKSFCNPPLLQGPLFTRMSTSGKAPCSSITTNCFTAGGISSQSDPRAGSRKAIALSSPWHEKFHAGASTTQQGASCGCRHATCLPSVGPLRMQCPIWSNDPKAGPAPDNPPESLSTPFSLLYNQWMFSQIRNWGEKAEESILANCIGNRYSVFVQISDKQC